MLLVLRGTRAYKASQVHLVVTPTSLDPLVRLVRELPDLLAHRVAMQDLPVPQARRASQVQVVLGSQVLQVIPDHKD